MLEGAHRFRLEALGAAAVHLAQARVELVAPGEKSAITAPGRLLPLQLGRQNHRQAGLLSGPSGERFGVVPVDSEHWPVALPPCPVVVGGGQDIAATRLGADEVPRSIVLPHAVAPRDPRPGCVGVDSMQVIEEVEVLAQGRRVHSHPEARDLNEVCGKLRVRPWVAARAKRPRGYVGPIGTQMSQWEVNRWRESTDRVPSRQQRQRIPMPSEVQRKQPGALCELVVDERCATEVRWRADPPHRLRAIHALRCGDDIVGLRGQGHPGGGFE